MSVSKLVSGSHGLTISYVPSTFRGSLIVGNMISTAYEYQAQRIDFVSERFPLGGIKGGMQK